MGSLSIDLGPLLTGRPGIQYGDPQSIHLGPGPLSTGRAEIQIMNISGSTTGRPEINRNKQLGPPPTGQPEIVCQKPTSLATYSPARQQALRPITQRELADLSSNCLGRVTAPTYPMSYATISQTVRGGSYGIQYIKTHRSLTKGIRSRIPHKKPKRYII